MPRVLRAAATVAALGAAAGGAAALAVGAAYQVALSAHGARLLLDAYLLAAAAGAVLGAALGLGLAFGLLRAVPLGRAAAGTALGGLLGFGVAAWLDLDDWGAGGCAVGSATLAALALRWWYARRALVPEPPPAEAPDT